MRRDRRKALYRRDRDSLKGIHEEAEIEHKALRRGKNLAFSENTCLDKERVRSKVIPREKKKKLESFSKASVCFYDSSKVSVCFHY